MSNEATGVRRSWSRGRRLLLVLVAACGAGLVTASGAGAAIPPSLHDPANCEQLRPAPGHVAWKCDDGVPDAGGTTPNETGEKAVTLPARYRGHRGLPRKAPDAASVPGADRQGQVALDVDVTLPRVRAGRRGYPLLVMMHGCCGGQKTSNEQDGFDAEGEGWHYSNAWFAARGYVVLTYTARGFVDGEGNGSTGEMQLQSRRFEINDYQHLACQLVGVAGRFSRVTGRRVRIDPRRVVATGGSYGGGFAWMAATDPRWRCTGDTGAGDTRMRLAAAAPKYGWTDLAYSLVPTGTHSARPRDLPARNGCDSGPRRPDGRPCPGGGMPVGAPKESIVAGLYESGRFGLPPSFTRTTFPAWVDDAVACLTSSYPPEGNALCSQAVSWTLPRILRESSAYYQRHFFRRLRRNPRLRVPIFSAATFTDPLFPPIEHLRMANRLLRIDRRYPIRTYHGDYQHFVQNKAKEWGDICAIGDERRVCTSADYIRGFDRPPRGRVRTGVTTMLNRFIDHYARPPGARRPGRPPFGVTASLQVCPQNSAAEGERFAGQPADEPGPTFRARTLGRLAPNRLRLELDGTQTTQSTATPNPHALSADPIANQVGNDRRCPVETEPAGPGVAAYTSAPLPARRTMVGQPRLAARFSVLGASGVQLNARLYDVYPDGSAVMVTRGMRRLTDAEAETGSVAFELHGNGWRFPRGHRIRIELAQDDAPYLKRSTVPSSLTIQGVTLRLPVRER